MSRKTERIAALEHVEQDEPFDHEHAEAAWAAYDVAVERLEADRG